MSQIRILRCQRKTCKHIWIYTGSNYRTTCPQCGTTVRLTASHVPVGWDTAPFKLKKERRKNTAYPFISNFNSETRIAFNVFSDDGETSRQIFVPQRVIRISQKALVAAIRGNGGSLKESGDYPLTGSLLERVQKMVETDDAVIE